MMAHHEVFILYRYSFELHVLLDGGFHDALMHF